ncbi:MAG: hypothetical protein ACFFG0_46915 [Candidatus Thorarchaeota archaeon]
MVSEEMEEVIKLLRSLQSNNSTVLSIEQLRKYTDQTGETIKIPNDVKCNHIDINGVPAVWETNKLGNI